MESKDTTSKVEEQGQSKLIDSSNQLKNLKSDYFIHKFFGYMTERKYLKIIRYNKSIQKRIDININHYKVYSEKYLHVSFNDNKKKDIERTSSHKYDNISKISIIIDYQIKSFSELFD